MSTVLAPNQLELFAGSSAELIETCSSKSIYVINDFASIIRKIHTYTVSDRKRVPVELRMAYAQFVEKTHLVKPWVLVGIGMTTHYRWLKDYHLVQSGKAEVRTYIKRKV